MSHLPSLLQTAAVLSLSTHPPKNEGTERLCTGDRHWQSVHLEERARLSRFAAQRFGADPALPASA